MLMRRTSKSMIVNNLIKKRLKYILLWNIYLPVQLTLCTFIGLGYISPYCVHISTAIINAQFITYNGKLVLFSYAYSLIINNEQLTTIISKPVQAFETDRFGFSNHFGI